MNCDRCTVHRPRLLLCTGQCTHLLQVVGLVRVDLAALYLIRV